MPALDANVLVRYVVRDDVAQLAAARRLIARCIDEGQSLFAPATVVLELEWVLRSSIDCSRDEVIQVLSNLDCVHVALAAQAGEQPLWTFDRRAARIPGAQLLGR